jgi:hypothetical protein
VKVSPQTLAIRELAVASQQCTISHFFVTRESLTKNSMIVVPHPPYFSLFPRLKVKLKGCNSDITEVIEAESQAMLNTLTEHVFQDAFKNGVSTENSAYVRKGATSRAVVDSRSKVSF